MSIFKNIFPSHSEREVKRIMSIVDEVEYLKDKYSEMDDNELKEQTNVLRKRLASGETEDDILPDAFAVVREASTRVLGMTHYKVQIIGGIVLPVPRTVPAKQFSIPSTK